MADLFMDCTTKDLERIQAVSNRLMLAFQAMQVEATRDLEPRDQMIVTVASLQQLQEVADRVTKKAATPRFVRSIRQAVKIARAFGTGNLSQGS
jgi:hypothetical protein